MSLILDALRKADAERERGSVPGLHAQTAPPPFATSARAARPWTGWAVMFFVAAVLVGVAVYWLMRPAVDGVTARPPATPAPAPAPVAPPNRPPPIAPAEIATPAPWNTPEPPALSTPPTPSASSSASGSANAAPAAAVARTAAAQPDAKIAAAEAPIISRDRLAEELRAQLPPMTIGGSIYSANAASRSVIINGLLYREGDTLAADLVLERIQPKSLVFRFKGARFEQAF